MKISSLQSIKWVWSLSFGGVVWVGFSFVAVVPEAVPEMLEPMPYLRIHLHLLGHYAYMHGTSTTTLILWNISISQGSIT